MTIDWGALTVVAMVSLVVGVLVVVLVSFALVGLSARELDAAGEPAEEAPVIGRRRRLSPLVGTVTAVLCLLAAAAIVLYGFSLIVF